MVCVHIIGSGALCCPDVFIASVGKAFGVNPEQCIVLGVANVEHDASWKEMQQSIVFLLLTPAVLEVLGSNRFCQCCDDVAGVALFG